MVQQPLLYVTFPECDRSLVAGIFYGEIQVFGNRGFPHEKTIHLFRGIFQLAMFDDQRVTRFPVDGWTLAVVMGTSEASSQW